MQDFNDDDIIYTVDEAIEEANRCLQCKVPSCVKGCPVSNKIPEFIKFIKDKNFQEAYDKLIETHCLPSVCSRVCSQENQCEKSCVRGIKGKPISIGKLEKFVSLNVPNKDILKSIDKNKKVAVIGSGPAGIACATELIKSGYDVTMFEANKEVGGLLKYGIPYFRLSKEIINEEFKILIKAGLKIKLNSKVNSINNLFSEGYEAIFLGIGVGVPKLMNIEGENLNGVIFSNEFLKVINFNKENIIKKLGNKVIIVGGGNVAIDVSRTLLRMGVSDVTLLYRRSFEEMTANKSEIDLAIREGVNIKVLTNIKKIIGDDNGNVVSVECVKFKSGEVDNRGKKEIIEIDNSKFVLNTNNVIIAIGAGPDLLLNKEGFNVDINREGYIIVDSSNNQTSRKGVFAGGDIVTGPRNVVSAINQGQTAAKGIDEYLS